jgi:hypothetical protein
MPNQLQHLTANFAGIVRNDQMENRDYLVVPMIMLTEGVHAGSGGPIFYPEKELSKTPMVWNTKPVVVYHPTKNGQPISACDPEVLSVRKIGVIMNARFEGNKLKAEAWIEKHRAELVDSRVIEAMEEGTVMELSTGLFFDSIEEEGEWNGEEYDKVAVNIRPDHLAVLPDQIGACSVADGAGFLRTNQKEKTNNHLSQNELGFDEIRNQLYGLVKAQHPDDSDYSFVVDIYDTYFIYELNGTLYKQEYKSSGKQISLGGIPEKVIRVVSYEPKSVVNQRKENDMTKKERVDALIANTATKWDEKDREYLMNQDEKILEKMEVPVPVKNEEKKEEKKEEQQTGSPAPAANTKTEETKKEEIAQNTNKPKTVQEYISSAPAEIQAVLNHGLNAYQAEKKRLINIITANENNTFTEAHLNLKDNAELAALARLAKGKEMGTEQPMALYSGLEEVSVQNSEVEILDVPVMNWDEPSKK